MAKLIRKPITVVQGAQWGSEAKGAVTGYLCIRENVDVCVRTGAVNAGHTVMFAGKPYKMQQLPCGWVNPDTELVIGAGALIHPKILQAECEMVTAATGHDIRNRLLIDYRAGVHTEAHTAKSTASGRHHAMGATGKGSSEALIERIQGRSHDYKPFGRLDLARDFQVGDTALDLNYRVDEGAKVLLEATQGTALDLYTGPYPFTTHKSTLVGNWMAEAGLSPSLPVDVVSVVRTFPIRVAGNSGPMPNEITWPMLAREINNKRREAGRRPVVQEASIQAFEEACRSAAARVRMAHDHGVAGAWTLPGFSDGCDLGFWTNTERDLFRVAASEFHKIVLESLSDVVRSDLSRLFEFTTVTKKLRRVARLSSPELRKASLLNRPSRVFVTFMNYLFPEDFWWGDHEDMPACLTVDQQKFIQDIEVVSQAPVTHVSFGPGPEHVLARIS